ncbi:putative cytoplasmic membrane protein CbiL [Actinobacillus ureae]|uniref:Nickel transport protein n=1 Tax=Actinobacillus ureae ATCC 25976 TaxID=887324 RepID=E8KF07_9PAST|nr:hypothetical protein [Actinobacillus ureae]EFX92537.1 hypothetical protein HMPREF0027_0424 [Actinobacillus ureae ATCC 25976]SUT88241.1 putative cytoplasmic membrane protein CbiL [Actinobacillus ureae]SUU50139.1 putative cytoplasmic membrane protein CbiL [Actinobacillus ureae]
MKLKQYLLGILFAFVSLNTSAHSLHLFALYDGHEISGKSFYSDQSPAAETYLEVFRLGKDGSENVPIATAKTDVYGSFSIPISGDGPFKVVVEGAEGHRAEGIADNVVKRTLGRAEFEVLREDIQKLKHKIYLHDLIGGIGYIFGLFGIITLLKARKDKS